MTGEPIYSLLTGDALARVRERERELANLAATFYRPGVGVAQEMEAKKAVAARADEMLAESIEEGEPFDFNLSGYALAEAIVCEAFWNLDAARWSAREATNGDSASWDFVDVLAEGAKSIEPPSIGGVIYPASRHLLSGESGCGKSWYALQLVAEEMRARRAVVYVDTDDMGAARFLGRLRALGIDDETIAARFRLVRPDRAVTEEGLGRIIDAIGDDDQGVRLVVVDSWNPALGLEGLDPLKTTDLDTWLMRFAKPINDAGAALLVLDHVPKGSDNQRGGYAYGAERKRSGVTVHLSMKALEPFGFGKVGRARITVEKDRDGHIGPRGTVVGIFEMHAKHDGSRVTPRMVEDVSRGEDGFRPTALMERVSIFLEGHEPEGEPVPRKAIEEGVSGRASYVRQALDVLVREGNVSEMEGARGARLYVLHEPYSEAVDYDRSEVVPTSSPHGTRTNANPSESRRPSSPSIGDEDEDEVRDSSTSSLRSSRGQKKKETPGSTVCVVCEGREALDGRVTCEECAS